MKRTLIVGCVVLTLLFLTTQVCAHGIGGLGSFGDVHESFGHPGFQGFSHFDHFQHEQRFGPHQHLWPFIPPGHEEHAEHEFFFGLHHHFDGLSGGFPDGFFRDRDFFFGRSFFPLSPRVVVIRSPFFCFPDGLEFTDQALFFDHLHQVHGIPVEQAVFFCRQLLGGRLIFFGF